MTIIQKRRGTAAAWVSANTVLAAGEQGLETDTLKTKTGNGSTAWNSLAYDPTGGATAFSGLTDRATVDLTSVNTPLQTALGNLTPKTRTVGGAALTSDVALKTVAGVSLVGTGDIPAGGAPTATSWASGSIALDLVNGREYGLVSITSNTTLSIAPGAVLNGNASFTVVRDGTHTLDLSAFALAGNTMTNGAGDTFEVAIIKRPTSTIAFLTYAGALDTTAPQPQAAFVNNATSTVVQLPYNEALVPNGIVAADVTVSGHTVSSIAVSGSELDVTLTSQVFYGETPTISVAANKLKDAAGNLCAAVVGATITNFVNAASPPSTAAVANASPTHVDMVWPVAMDTTSGGNPAASALSVSGHTVSAHTWVDSTHSYATVDTFAASEARVLGYTKPGSGNMFKTAAGNPVGNFAAIGITDNVTGGGTTTLFDDVWAGSSGANVDVAWSDQYRGTNSGFVLDGAGHAHATSGVSSNILQDTGQAAVTLTTTITGWANANNGYPGFMFRADALIGPVTFGNLLVHSAINKLRLYEHHGGTDDNIQDGTTNLVDGTPYALKIVLSGTSALVYLNGTLEITATVAQGLTNTIHGIQSAGGCSTDLFGETKATHP